MTTGTEGNDTLANNRFVLDEVVDALGGDDLITVTEPDSATNPFNSESVRVNGGDGFDTLILNVNRRLDGMQVTGLDGVLFIRVSMGNSYSVRWTSIERLEITSSLNGGTYATGDSIDIFRLTSGLGGTLRTGGGDDQIYFSEQPGGAAGATAYGGTGNDIIDYSATTAYASSGYRGFGEDGNDRLVGSGFTDGFDGGAGNDTFYLNIGPADPILNSDSASGGSGNDIFFFGATLASTDIVNGGEGDDSLVVQGNYAGGLTLSANVTQIEALSLLGGTNTSLGQPGTNRFDYVITTNDANFAAGIQAKVNGANLADGEDFTFNGTNETDAHFVVYGSKGVDTLTGGFGNDIFIYAEQRFAPGDTVNGGPGGYDGIFFRGNYTIDFNAPGYNGLMTSIENMTLSSATDERYARGGGTEFDYNITLADNQLLAGVELTVSGNLLTAIETMILDASLESDGTLRIFGGKAGDTLKGGGQADLIHGNLGADVLTGNGGADVFRYDTIAESKNSSLDQILDFTPGTDRIDLSRIDANSQAAGDQAFAWIGSSAFSGTAGELRAVNLNNMGWVLEGDSDGNGLADFAVMLTLQGSTPLSASDFIL